MNINSLLALLLGLQKFAPNNHSTLKTIARSIEFKSTPEKIQAEIDTALAENLQFKQAYQTIKANLDALIADIPAHLLPSEAEIEAFSPQQATRGGKPGKHTSNNDEINNFLKISKAILNHPTPQEASKSLLKRLTEWLEHSK